MIGRILVVILLLPTASRCAEPVETVTQGSVALARLESGVSMNNSQSWELTSMELSRDTFSRVMQEPALKRMQLHSFSPPGGIAKLLTEQKELEELTLICLTLSEADLLKIATLPRLRVLDLRGCQFECPHLDVLVQCPLLEELDLRGTSITFQQFERLREQFPLTRVDHCHGQGQIGGDSSVNLIDK